MDSKFILEILKYVFYALNTNIPYKWDFCRLPLEGNIRLYINVGSYIIAYASFVFWFTKYVLWELKSLAGERLGNRHWYSAIGLSLSTATQVLWPVFLMSTYFVSCSFYPWFTATVVLFLNVGFFMSSLIVDGARESKSMLQAAFSRWKWEVKSQWSSDSIDYSSDSHSFEDIPNMEKKETIIIEKQPMERTCSKSLISSLIGSGFDKMKSLFQTAFGRVNTSEVQPETSSGSDMENKDPSISEIQSTESTSSSSLLDDNYIHTVIGKARSYIEAFDDEPKITQSDPTGRGVDNPFASSKNTQILDRSVSEPQEADEFKDDRDQTQDRKSTMW